MNDQNDQNDNLQDNNLQNNDLKDNNLQNNNLQDNNLQDNNLQDNNLQNSDLQDGKSYNDCSYGELTRMIEPEVLKMGIGQRVVSIFASPGELMRNIKVYPVILVPFLMIILLSVISIPISLQIGDLVTNELSIISIERYGIDIMDLGAFDVYGDLDDMASLMDAVAVVGAVIGAIVGPLIICALSAFGFWVFSKIFRGKATFTQLFSMYTHVYVIMTVGTILVSWLMISTDRLLDMTSLAAVLMPDGNISMLSFNALSAISIFSLWSSALTYLGLKILNDFAGYKAAIITVFAFLFYMAVHIIIYMSTFLLWDMAMA